MKTKILVFFMAVSLLFSFNLVQAQVTTLTPELEALAQTIRQQIQDIREKIILLQEQIKEINPEYKPRFIPELKTEFKEIKGEIKFTRNLRKGLRGQEVKDLQEFLSQYPEIYPEKLVTGYFGALTERAVKKFQEKHSNDVLKPHGLNKGTGFVGKSTIAKLNQLTSQDKKVIICHYPPGNPDARRTIVISKSALEAHLALGSTVGPCTDEPEPDPDPEPDTTAPAEVTDFTAVAGDTEVELSWVNPVDSDFEKVKIMRKVDAYSTGVTDGDEVYDGDEITYTDTGLTNGTTYYYKAFTYDDVPNYSVGAEVSATPEVPVADTTAPAEITDFTAVAGDTEVELSWVNPVDSDFEKVKILRKIHNYPSGVTGADSVEVYDGTETTYADTGLTNGTTYYYKAFTYDEVPNYSVGAEVTATPVE